MRSVPFWTRYIFAFFKRFRAVIFISTLIGAFMFAFSQIAFSRLFTTSTRIIGVTGRYHVEELPLDLLEGVGEGLTALDEKGRAVPALAKSWETDDGKTWTFILAEDKVWQDGTAVTSDTVQYSFEDMEVERPDSHTIVFKLESEFAPFPIVVSRPTFKQGLLGTGSVKITDIKLAGTFVGQITRLHTKTGEKEIIRLYPTEEQLKIAFQMGHIDQMSGLFDAQEFSGWPTVTISEELSRDRYVGIFFNNEAQVFSGNKQIRQALSYAINKTSLGERAVGPIAPTSWAFNPQVKDYAYDVDRALELLEEAPSINLATTPALLPVAERVADYWREIGVEVTVQVSTAVPSDYQAFLAVYETPEDPDQYSTWHGSQIGTNNIARFSNDRINKLLEDGRLEINEEARRKIYLDFQRFLLEEAPAVFLYHPISYTVSRK